jgi:DNA-binding transcriptional LysR family regulator
VGVHLLDCYQEPAIPMFNTQRVSSSGMDLRLLRYFVAVAEERHFGRAAARLHMSQPPLSRAIKQLEADLGAVLPHRSPTGVTLTAAGDLLYGEARTLLEQADQTRARVAALGASTLTVGTIADSAEEAGTRLAAAFRQQNPGVGVRIREADFTDPTAGVRAGFADVAITRMPFDRTRIATLVLRSDPVGVVLRADDPTPPDPVVHAYRCRELPPGGRREVSLSGTGRRACPGGQRACRCGSREGLARSLVGPEGLRWSQGRARRRCELGSWPLRLIAAAGAVSWRAAIAAIDRHREGGAASARLPVPLGEFSLLDVRVRMIEPMQHGRPFLAGDAACLITPAGGKGMNLAPSSAHGF